MIGLSISGNAKLREKLAASADRVRNLGPGLLRAGLVVTTAAQNRIRSGGDGAWPPAKVDPRNKKGQVRGTLLYRSGTLFRSLAQAGGDHVQNLSGNTLEVGTSVRYAKALNFGTVGMTIQSHSRRGKPFSYTGNIPARRFLYIDDQDARNIRNIFLRYIMQGEA